jgi:glyoxylase-like metal-dependent hydrolase (beta-lactamase superfamily II)
VRRLGTIVLVLLVLVGVALIDTDRRRFVMLPLIVLTTEFPEALTPAAEGPTAEWFDDYYTITRIDEQTIAIGEPLSHSQNYNYLLLGEERALLFDSGPGFHDIRPVVASLTSLPVTAVPSHLRYDHIGSHMKYERLALLDLPELRRRVADGALRLRYGEHLGVFESVPLPTLRPTQWLTPDSTIDLGGRPLLVLHTPGHTPDSMALFDRARDQLFIGDFITEGPAFLFVPGSSVGDQLRTAERLSVLLGERTALHTAHRFDPPGLPTLERADVLAMRDTLRRLEAGTLAGTGWWPREYPVNDNVWLYTDFEWAQRWDPGPSS